MKEKMKLCRPAAAAFLAMMAMAVTSSTLSFFLEPISAELQVGRGSLSLIFSLMTISGALVNPALGQYAGRKGVRGILAVCGLWGCGSLLLLSRSDLWVLRLTIPPVLILAHTVLFPFTFLSGKLRENVEDWQDEEHPDQKVSAEDEILSVVEEIIQANRDVVVIVDEAYIDFSSEPSLSGYINEYPNLIVLQTLSKAYGMAALRLGLAFGDERTMGMFANVKYPYNISLAGMEKAMGLLKRDVSAEVELIKTEQRLLAGGGYLPLAVTC